MRTILTITTLLIVGALLTVLFITLKEEERPLAKLDFDGEIDNIIVEKSKRELHLLSNGEIVKTYHIALGGQPVGAKEREGDNRTPEGTYHISLHNPRSSYHLSLRVSYPNAEQIKKAKENGYSAGGDIMIHGLPNKANKKLFKLWHNSHDWTAGCIAVTDEEVEEIYYAVKDGTPITINP